MCVARRSPVAFLLTILPVFPVAAHIASRATVPGLANARPVPTATAVLTTSDVGQALDLTRFAVEPGLACGAIGARKVNRTHALARK